MATYGSITASRLKRFLAQPIPERDNYLRGPDGFAVRRHAHSGSATFIVEAKIRGTGRSSRIPLGPASRETLDEMRELGRGYYLRMRSGEDVKRTLQQERELSIQQQVSLEDALERMLSDKTELKPNTVKMYRDTFKNSAGSLRRRLIIDLDIAMIRDQLRRIEKRKSAESARKLRATLSATIGFAITEWNLKMTNPVREIKGVGTSVKSRQGFVEDRNMGSFLRAIARVRKAKKTHGNYLLFLLATGCRKNEAARLRWRDVDFDRMRTTFVDTKNGRHHCLPMTDFVAGILRDQMPLTGRADPEGYVFPGRRKGTAIWDLRHSIDKFLDSEKHLWLPGHERKRNLTIHDLRRTAATHMEGVGVPHRRVSMLLNHSGSHITDRYIQQNSASLLESLTKYHAWLASL